MSVKITRLHKVILEEAASPSLSPRTIVQAHLPGGANVHAHLGTTPLTTQNGSSIGSAVFARLMPHSPYM